MLRARISPDEWAKLRKLAASQHTSVSAIVGQLIREHLNERGEK